MRLSVGVRSQRVASIMLKKKREKTGCEEPRASKEDSSLHLSKDVGEGPVSLEDSTQTQERQTILPHMFTSIQVV